MRPLVWFRSDLRTADHPALHAACAEATRGVVAVFLVAPDQWRAHDWADARVDFVLRTLVELRGALDRLRVPLLVETAPGFDDAPDALVRLARRHACDGVFFNREYEVNERARDRVVVARFEREGLEARAFTDQVILPPGSVRTGKGDFYTVFTPFRKAWCARVTEQGVPKPLARPRPRPAPVTASHEPPVRVEGFAPDAGRPDLWPAGERVAARRLRRYVERSLADYARERDRPDLDTTSRLSPYLAVGAISARRCLAAAVDANGGRLEGGRDGAATWISELIWREFYRHVLVGFPRVCRHRAFKPETERIRWRRSDRDFEAWCDGRTGFPIVDAAMRQLRDEGWMHNRLRMITAMFLAKDLLLDWRRGERHFMRHLVDGDLASNNGGWQWAASTGTDAAPYFRIFNPASQSRKVDPDGTFIRRHVPELRDVEGDAVHEPARIPPRLRAGVDYPAPIVDHAAARARAIAAFRSV